MLVRSMELRVKGNTFYVLAVGDDKRIYDSEQEAILSLKRIVSEKEDINPEDINIFEVNMSKERWEIKTIPWSRIALALIREGVSHE